MPCVLTPDQETFRRKALTGANVVGRGYPGCGKTLMLTTIYLQLPDVVQRDAYILAYNKHSKQAFEQKLGRSRNIMTLDGLNYRIMADHLNIDFSSSDAFRKWPMDNDRHWRFVRMFAREYWPDALGYYTRRQEKAMEDLVSTVDLVMANVTPYRDRAKVDGLARSFGLQFSDPQFVHQGLPILMDWCMKGLPKDFAYNDNRYTLKDSWMPVDLAYAIATDPSIQVRAPSAILTDELQDVSVAQAKCTLRCLTKDGGVNPKNLERQFVGVGDENQSIYFFRGIRADMFNKIQSVYDADVVEMSTSFRLPKSALPAAQKYVPGIQCADDAIEGEDRTMDMNGLLEVAGPGCKYISLTKAGCVKAALYLLGHNKAAVVKGKDIGFELTDTFKVMEQDKAFKFAELPKASDAWYAEQAAIIKDAYQNPDDKLERLQDRVLSLRCVWEAAWNDGIRDGKAFKRKLKTMFVTSDDADAYSQATECMTGHGSKGLEFDTVVLEQSDLDSTRKFAAPEEARQHQNTLYVMSTRHTNRKLRIVEGKIKRNNERW